MKRKHISWKTRCASLLLQLGDIPYSDGKQMTEDQILSLYHLDHNMLHSSLHEDRDKFWNFTHLLIKAHRLKTKVDAAIIAKGRRIRAKLYPTHPAGDFGDVVTANVDRIRTIRSRGFDKTLRKKLDGTVVKRER